MVLGFTTIYAIVAYHHWSCDFQSRSWRSVLDTTVCYLRQVGGFLQVLRFLPPVQVTAIEILLKVALNTIKLYYAEGRIKSNNTNVWHLRWWFSLN